jgi:hypothetical protein
MKTRLQWRRWWGLTKSAFGDILESGGRFCVGALCRNLASVAVKMFSYLTRNFMFFTFSAICEDNAAINFDIIFDTKIFVSQL